MSTTAPPQPNAEPGVEPCSRCGHGLPADQEWCLECGLARTRIRSAPDLKIAAAVVGAVLVVALGALAVVLVNLSTNTNRELAASSTSATRSSAVNPAASTPAGAAGGPADQTPRTAIVASWPVGLSGWTVVLDRVRTQSRAEARARRVAVGGLSVGVLDTSQHPAMRPGAWIVFSGRYPGQPRAAAAARALRTQGHPTARPVEVAPPGGL